MQSLYTKSKHSENYLPKAGRSKNRLEKEPVKPGEKKKKSTTAENVAYGIQFDSKEEAWTYRALIELGYENKIRIQQSIYGGRAVTGGQVVDFVIETPVLVPVRVQGNRWHANDAKEQLNAQKIMQYYGRFPIDLWTSDMPNYEACLMLVKKYLGRAD